VNRLEKNGLSKTVIQYMLWGIRNNGRPERWSDHWWHLEQAIEA
jgi:hypothetical protein